MAEFTAKSWGAGGGGGGDGFFNRSNFSKAGVRNWESWVSTLPFPLEITVAVSTSLLEWFYCIDDLLFQQRRGTCVGRRHWGHWDESIDTHHFWISSTELFSSKERHSWEEGIECIEGIERNPLIQFVSEFTPQEVGDFRVDPIRSRCPKLRALGSNSPHSFAASTSLAEWFYWFDDLFLYQAKRCSWKEGVEGIARNALIRKRFIVLNVEASCVKQGWPSRPIELYSLRMLTPNMKEVSHYAS